MAEIVPNSYKFEVIITVYSLLTFYGSFVVFESDDDIVYMLFFFWTGSVLHEAVITYNVNGIFYIQK